MVCDTTAIRDIIAQHGRLSGNAKALSDTDDLYRAGLRSEYAGLADFSFRADQIDLVIARPGAHIGHEFILPIGLRAGVFLLLLCALFPLHWRRRIGVVVAPESSRPATATRPSKKLCSWPGTSVARALARTSQNSQRWLPKSVW